MLDLVQAFDDELPLFLPRLASAFKVQRLHPKKSSTWRLVAVTRFCRTQACRTSLVIKIFSPSGKQLLGILLGSHKVYGGVVRDGLGRISCHIARGGCNFLGLLVPARRWNAGILD
jgi:hypothetical protein